MYTVFDLTDVERRPPPIVSQPSEILVGLHACACHLLSAGMLTADVHLLYIMYRRRDVMLPTC